IVFETTSPPPPPPRNPAPAPEASPIDVASIVAPMLNTLPCSWVTAENGGAANLRLAGVAGDPDAMTSQLQARACSNVGLDRTQLFRVAPAACGVVEAFRKIRESASGAPSLRVAATDFLFVADQTLCPPHPRPAGPPLCP